MPDGDRSITIAIGPDQLELTLSSGRRTASSRCGSTPSGGGFALLRSSHAIGLIVASALIALISLDAAFLVSAALALISVVVVTAMGMSRR
jgi:hypothetical protein